MAFLAGFVLHSHIEAIVFGLPFSVFTGLLYMVTFGSAAALTTFFLPKLRRLVDSIAFARVSLAFLTVATQNYELAMAPLISAIMIISSAIILLAIGKRIALLAQKKNAPQHLVSFVFKVGTFFYWLDNSEGYAEAFDLETASVRATSAKT